MGGAARLDCACMHVRMHARARAGGIAHGIPLFPPRTAYNNTLVYFQNLMPKVNHIIAIMTTHCLYLQQIHSRLLEWKYSVPASGWQRPQLRVKVKSSGFSLGRGVSWMMIFSARSTSLLASHFCLYSATLVLMSADWWGSIFCAIFTVIWNFSLSPSQ